MSSQSKDELVDVLDCVGSGGGGGSSPVVCISPAQAGSASARAKTVAVSSFFICSVPFMKVVKKS